MLILPKEATLGSFFARFPGCSFGFDISCRLLECAWSDQFEISIGSRCVPITRHSSNRLKHVIVDVKIFGDNLICQMNTENLSQHQIVIAMLYQLNQLAFQVDERFTDSGWFHFDRTRWRHTNFFKLTHFRGIISAALVHFFRQRLADQIDHKFLGIDNVAQGIFGHANNIVSRLRD